jgi:hypothetical protein
VDHGPRPATLLRLPPRARTDLTLVETGCVLVTDNETAEKPWHRDRTALCCTRPPCTPAEYNVKPSLTSPDPPSAVAPSPANSTYARSGSRKAGHAGSPGPLGLPVLTKLTQYCCITWESLESAGVISMGQHVDRYKTKSCCQSETRNCQRTPQSGRNRAGSQFALLKDEHDGARPSEIASRKSCPSCALS